MAGAVAALAARERGARVVLARRSGGATALSSGAVCVGSDPRALPGDLFRSRERPAAAARWIAAIRPEHPYAVLGEGLFEIDDALGFAARELSSVLAPFEDDGRWLMTPFGSVRECGLCQRTILAGDLAAAEGVLAVVGLRGHLGFDARLVAAGVARVEGLGAPRAEPIEIDLFMTEAEAVGRPQDLARVLESPGAAESAGALLRQALPRGATAALFPPILGLSPAIRAADRIAESAGIPVAEIASDLPSVPGLRLDAAIQARLAEAGIEVVSGEVPLGGPGSPVSVAGRTVTARSWILATGRFASGGLVRRSAIEEPLLGIPVEIPARPGEPLAAHLAGWPTVSLTAQDGRSTQRLFTAGIRFDPELRPLGPDGKPIHPHLHAAGAILGGTDPAWDGTGLGVAILTGYLAGRAAAGAP